MILKEINFSEFLKILYKYYGSENNAEQFVQSIFASAMNKDDIGHFLSEDSAKKIFGGRAIPKQLVSKAISNLDKENFVNYLDKLSNDAILKINSELVFDKTLNVKNKDSVDDMYGKIFDILVWFLDNPDRNFVFNISPTNNLPHSKNPYFTGRTETLDLIYKNFYSGNSVSLIQSVKGLGGVGKTSIALEYAYSRFNEYRTIWWINAETEQNILNDYKSFGLRQKIISDDLKPDEIIDIIKNWFDTNENWLFIYDNADSADFNEWFEHYLPRINKGHILVTTRSNFFPKSNSIDVTVFTESESIEFLKKRTNKSGGGYSNELAKKLSEQLQYLPLALEQAAAYIVETPGVTYQDYIELFDEYGTDIFKDDEKKTYLVDYTSTVAITWQISMNKITQDSTVQMLNMCAYFAPNKIPVNIFVQGSEVLPDSLKTEITRKLERNDIIRDLTRYSLLSCEKDDDLLFDEKRILYMHRLLQEVVQKSFADNEWLAYCLELLCTVIDWKKGGKEEIEAFKIESPHAIIIAEKSVNIFKEDYEKLAQSGWIFNVLSAVYRALGEPAGALEYAKKDIAICEKVYDAEHPHTATSYNNMGEVYSILGEPKVALDYYNNALAIYEKVYGEEHPHTATSYNNIGGAYHDLGEIEKALDYYNKAMMIDEKIYGNEHPQTAVSYSNIGEANRMLNEPEKALNYFDKGLKIREKFYGEEQHPDISTSYNNMGGIYLTLGEPAKALEYFNKALAILEKVYGKEHPHIADSYYNIGYIHVNIIYEPAKAIEHFNKALALYEKIYGCEHPYTAMAYSNIGYAYSNIESDKALEYGIKAVAVYEKVYGAEHPDTAMSYSNIGYVYSDIGELEKALDYCIKALKIFEKAYGNDHFDTVTVRENIEYIYNLTEK